MLVELREFTSRIASRNLQVCSRVGWICAPGWVGEHQNATLAHTAQHNTARPGVPRDQADKRAQQLATAIAGLGDVAADVAGEANATRPEVMSAALTDFVRDKLRMQVTSFHLSLNPGP